MARILVVEDEPAIALALEDDLRFEGHDVEVTGEGAAAIALGREGRFDLVLLDIMLIGKDGLDVCRELRRTGVTTPIIMLTARSQEAEKVLAFESGADDYVTKPFGTRELRARIAALLRRASGPVPKPQEATLRVGGTVVDFDRGEVRRGDSVATLTSLEFKLLQVFARNRGRILTRDQLIEGAWGHGVFVSERVVDNHIGALRRKLEADATEPRHLLNIRGLGYRFDV
jgi:two-component system alkaline phosphatase synthesis response regulator PhoP